MARIRFLLVCSFILVRPAGVILKCTRMSGLARYPDARVVVRYHGRSGKFSVRLARGSSRTRSAAPPDLPI